MLHQQEWGLTCSCSKEPEGPMSFLWESVDKLSGCGHEGWPIRLARTGESCISKPALAAAKGMRSDIARGWGVLFLPPSSALQQGPPLNVIQLLPHLLRALAQARTAEQQPLCFFSTHLAPKVAACSAY